MTEIAQNLFVGRVEDLQSVDDTFSVLGACKEPLHRQHAKLEGADTEGYLGRAMPKGEKEYLYAERDHALYCNLIDAPISDEIIDRALRFIDEEMAQRRKVLIVCNKAESRSPSIALMWMAKNNYIGVKDASAVIEYFEKFMYPIYNPGEGFKQYVIKFIGGL